jgi:hypothetical protein
VQPAVPAELFGKIELPGDGIRHNTRGGLEPEVYCSNLTLSAVSVNETTVAKDEDAAKKSREEITNLNNFIANTSKN